MKLLEDRIKRDGVCIGTEIVKVDSFLNHQLDPALLSALGEEFFRLFKEECPNKILTCESSGIALAVFAAKAFGDIPVVFAKKALPSTITEGVYSAEIRSFTKGNVCKISVSEKFLSPDDRVLIIDDFLASGEAGVGLFNLIKQSGGECVGFSAAIEKAHQGGRKRLEALGVRVESLAVISSIKDGNIYFN